MAYRMISPILFSHENVALQFSGGKDSLAVAHLLRPYWDRLTFYHVDAGDLLPEVREIVADMERQVPRFVRIASDSAGWAAENGLPSDLVPHTGTLSAKLMGARTRISGRYECCGHNLWLPMHARMVADGVTLVIRGTKRCDMAKLPAATGDISMGYQIWLPIEDWSHDEVFAYLNSVGAPICRVYESAVNAPECATCPAWWNEGRAAYLARYHPDLSAIYRGKLAAVAAEVAPVWATLQAEMAHG
jgi:3'-phosphoadenosine 5'-phosphosulfate sulfotransferase (PAPS reductase)/FAD synthetase